jgi:hypothetical protein
MRRKWRKHDRQFSWKDNENDWPILIHAPEAQPLVSTSSGEAGIPAESIKPTSQDGYTFLIFRTFLKVVAAV